MYGTTIRSFNENKDIRNKKTKKEKSNFHLDDNKKEKKKFRKKDIDTQYMKLDEAVSDSVEEKSTMEGFSIKDLPIASVVVTLLLTMMLLVMTSGFGGL